MEVAVGLFPLNTSVCGLGESLTDENNGPRWACQRQAATWIDQDVWWQWPQLEAGRRKLSRDTARGEGWPTREEKMNCLSGHVSHEACTGQSSGRKGRRRIDLTCAIVRSGERVPAINQVSTNQRRQDGRALCFRRFKLMIQTASWMDG